MDVSMEVTVEGLEAENIELTDSLKILEAENNVLTQQLGMLEKKLEKEKKFHRKFAEEVSASEAVRFEDFKHERRAYTEENKSLVRENRQLKKDVEFYKKAHAELTKEDETTSSSNQPEKPREEPATASAHPSRYKTVYLPNNCTHKSAKVLGKVNEKLYADNKKLQLKIASLNGTIAILKKKIKQLETFKLKVDNKKAKFMLDSEVLEETIASVRTTNKDVYNSDVLAMFGGLP